MKRFWTKTEITADGDKFIVLLDERPVKLPSGKPLAVPFRALAEAIAAEWAAVGENFTPDDLPLTRLATTAQERIAAHRSEIVLQLAKYGMNDLLCYRAADEPALALREEEAWQPWLDWAERELGIALQTTTGIVPITQSPACEEAFIRRLNDMDEYQLAGLGVIVPALGSLVLALAVEAGTLAPETACACAHLGELWQETRWGTDDEAIARRRSVAEDVAVSARFMVLCRP
jgi:chaperone required for assembly of F1-ATPase